MFHEVGKELFFVFGDEPLVDADEVVFILLASYDLLLQDVRTSQLLYVPEEVPKAVELNDNISQIFPLWHHDVANKVVQVILHQTWNSQRFHGLEGFILDDWSVGL